MSGSKAPSAAAISGSSVEEGARSSTFDWDHFAACCDALGASTHEQRAEKAGLPERTYYRLKNGETSLTLTKLALVAERLGTSSARLMGLTS